MAVWKALIRTVISSSLVFGQLKISSDSLYLMDETDTPVFLNGDGGWDLMNNVTYAQADTYLTDCQEKGINFNQIRVLTPPLFNGTATWNNVYGVAPFSGLFFTNMNGAYWAHIDSVIGLGKQKGIYFQLYPAYLGYDGTQGCRDSITTSSNATMREYGKFIANRYKDSTNIRVNAILLTSSTGSRFADTDICCSTWPSWSDFSKLVSPDGRAVWEVVDHS